MKIAIFTDEIIDFKVDFIFKLSISEFTEIRPAFDDFKVKNNLKNEDIKVLDIWYKNISQSALYNLELADKLIKWAKQNKIGAVIYK